MTRAHTKKTQQSPGVHRARRPKRGLGRQLNIVLSEEEKAQIEQAAAIAGVSVSRFMMEYALKAAKKILRQTHPAPPKHVHLPAIPQPSKTSR